MPKTKRVGKYELKETLGKGNFSKVKRSVNVETGEINAIKIVNISNVEKEGLEKQVKREISVLKSIKHPNVVQMIEVLKSPNHIYIVMELITGGELFDKIVSVKRFEEKIARRYFQQLIDGISYCHSNKIAHRDLKPENLLLDDRDNLKISDFGLSGIMQNTAVMLSTICGTPHYVAPEVLTGNYNGMIADVWSCGIILFVMISGCHPFDGDTVQELFKRIENLEFKYPSYVSKEVRGLLDKIIVVDPMKRATLEDIKNDPWFKVDYNPLHKTSSIVLESDLPKSFRMPHVTNASSSSSLRSGEDEENNEDNDTTEEVPDIVISNEDVENSVRNIAQDEIVEAQSSYSAPSALTLTDTPPSHSPISSALTPAGTNFKASRSSRLQNTEQLNAFELVSLLNKEVLSPLITGHKIMRKTANFIVTEHPDIIYSNISDYLENEKQFSLKLKEHDYDMKAVSMGVSDLEFSIKLFVINLQLVVVQLSRLRGDTVKFLEMFGALEKKFSTH